MQDPKSLSFALPNSYIFFFKLFKNHSLKSLILLLKTLFFAFVRIKCFYHTKIIYTFNTNNTICRKLLQIQYNKAFLEKKISIILCAHRNKGNAYQFSKQPSIPLGLVCFCPKIAQVQIPLLRWTSSSFTCKQEGKLFF